MVRIILAVVLWVSVSPAVSAAADPPQRPKGADFPYPARAPVVISLNGYETARARLSKLIAAAVPDDAQKLTKVIDGELSRLLDGRKLTAMRQDARMFLVLNDLAALFEDETPPVALLIPITTYKDFRESFLTRDELKSLDQGREGVDAIKTAAFGEEKPAFMVDLKDYVALSLNKSTANGYVAKYVRGTLDGMGPDLAESFLKADLAVYVNMNAVNDQFGDQIRAFKGLIDFGLQQAAQQGAIPGFSARQMDAVKVVLKGAFQGVEDSRAVVLSVEFKREGLVVRLQARFAELSESAKLLARQAPRQMSEVGKLPSGLGVYAAMSFDRTIADALREVHQEFSTTADDARGIKLIERHMRDLAAADYQGEYSASSAPGSSITIAQYKDPGKAVRALTKAYKAIAPGGSVNAVILKTAPRVTDEFESVKDFKFSEVRLNYDLAATVAGLPDQTREATLQLLKRTVPEKTIMWIGTDGKTVVHLTADNWTAAQALLEKFLDGKSLVGSHASYRATRAQLPRDVNYLLIAETSSALNTLFDALRTTGEAIPGFPKLPTLKPIKGEPAYVGLSVTLNGDTATATGFVPIGAMTVARKLLEPLLKKID